MSRKLKNFINGEWIESRTDKYENVYNPATKEVLAQVPLSTSEDFEEAVQKAQEAQKNWGKHLLYVVRVFCSNTITYYKNIKKNLLL